MFRLALTAVALGLSNFAAAIGIGLSGIDRRVRVRVAIVFGAFEAAMPIIGLALGRSLATPLGSAGRYVGGALLIATGLYTAWRASSAAPNDARRVQALGPLVLTGAALSVDNLIVGFALGATNVSLPLAVLLVASVSIGLSLLGLELGNRLGSVVERRSGELGGAALVVVGIAIISGAL
jgi:putative Mn2+ efflux pump MntP